MRTKSQPTASLGLLMASAVVAASVAFASPVQAEGTVAIAVDGAPVTFSLDAGQEGTATFSGVKGERLTIQTIATNVTRYPSSTRDIDVDVVNTRTGRTVANVGGDYEDVFEGLGEAVTLPENGDYRIQVSPDQSFVGDVTITLKSPTRTTLLVGGSWSFTLEVGEEAIATFEGTKGQFVTVQTLARLVTRFPSNSRNLDVDVVNARTGRTVANVGDDYEDVFEGVGETVKLPVTGPYEIRVQPDQYFAGLVELDLTTPQTSDIQVGGGPLTVSLSEGEEAIMRFSGTKGQPVNVRTTALNVTRYPATFRDLDVYVVNARTGRTVANVGDDYEDVLDGVGETVRLPATGQYEIRISPDQYFTGDVTIELLSPETSPISVNGAPVSFNLGVGSEAIATFSARQGQRITVQTSISSDSIYPSSYSNLNVYLINARTGKRVSSMGDDYIDALDGISRTVTLREAGNYQLRVSPTQYFIGVVTITVRAQ